MGEINNSVKATVTQEPRKRDATIHPTAADRRVEMRSRERRPSTGDIQQIQCISGGYRSPPVAALPADARVTQRPHGAQVDETVVFLWRVPENSLGEMAKHGRSPSPSEPKSCACAEFGAEQVTALQSPIGAPLHLKQPDADHSNANMQYKATQHTMQTHARQCMGDEVTTRYRDGTKMT